MNPWSPKGSLRALLARSKDLRVVRLWNHPFRDFRLILEQDGDVRHYYVRADLQRTAVRGALATAGAAGALIGVFLLANVWLMWNRASLRADYQDLQSANREISSVNERIATLLGEPVATGTAATDGVALRRAQEDLAARVALRLSDLEKLSGKVERDLSQLNRLLVAGLSGRAATRAASRAGMGRGGIDAPADSRAEVAVAPFAQSDNLSALLAENERLQVIYRQLPTALPMSASEVSSSFGLRRHPVTDRSGFHQGVDLVPSADRRVTAALDGTVVEAGWDGGYGYSVLLQHSGGVTTRYSHLSRIQTSAGRVVKSGDPIGQAGSTGLSTGTHLHFELALNGRAIDPVAASIIAGHVQE